MALDRLKVQRDAEGNVVPREGKTLTLGLDVKVLPLGYGASQKYESFGLPAKRWTKKEKAMLLTENLLEVEGEEVGVVTEQEVDDFEAYALGDLMESILFLSAINRLYEGEGQNSGNESGAPAPESPSPTTP